MSEPINVGDLVMVVHSHCPGSALLGTIHTVREIRPNWLAFCRCGQSIRGVTMAYIADRDGYQMTGPLSWLKRIDPPDEQETTETREELTA